MESTILRSFAAMIVAATLGAAVLSGQPQPVHAQSYAVSDLGTSGGKPKLTLPENVRLSVQHGLKRGRSVPTKVQYS